MSTVAAPLESPLPQSQAVVSRRALLGIAVLVLAHVPILWRYLTALVKLPHYEFVMLLPVGVAVLAWPRCRQLGHLAPGRGTPFFFWMTGAVATLVTSVVLESPWFGAISALLATAGAAYAVGGRRLVLAILPAWALLWLGIRLPLTYDERLAQGLQRVAADRAASVMNYFGIEHIRDGNVVETAPVDGQERRYMVEEACSGVQSLFAVTACALFFALWMRDPPGRIALLLAVAWWWVWLANVVRVVAVTVLHSRWGLPVDKGFGHDVLTYVLFAATLGLIVSSEHLLLFLLPRGMFSRFERIDAGVVKPLPDFGPTRFPPLGDTRLASPVFIGCYLFLGALQWLPQLRVPEPTATEDRLRTVEATVAPAELNGWVLRKDGFTTEQRRADSQWGARSHTWRYFKGPREMVVSVDFPFHGWHELTICYEADGWLRKSRNVLPVPQVGAAVGVVADNEKCVESVLHRPELGSYAYLLFTSFNDRQQPLPAEQLNAYQKLVDRIVAFGQRIRTLGASGSGRNDQVESFQLQVFMQGAETPNKDDKEAALAMFVELRGRLGRYLAAGGPGGGP
jgi:exosortase